MIRVIPSLLALDGKIVKGRQASNNRVIGTIDSALRVQTARNVDEVALIDVAVTTSERRLSSYVSRASDFLRVPFTAGGGVDSVDEIGRLLTLGADKVLLGRRAFGQPGLVGKASRVFGSQAIMACLELVRDESGWVISNMPGFSTSGVSDYAKYLQDEGAGEILLFNKSSDGMRSGVAEDIAGEVSSALSVPTSYLGGVGSPSDAVKLAAAGVSAVVAGALFAFSQYTPNDVKRSLLDHGFEVRL